MDPPMGGTTFFLFFLTIAKMDTQNLESFGVVPNCVFFLHNRLLGILVPINRFYFIFCLQCGIYYYFSLGTLHIVPFEIYSLVIKTCFGHRHGKVFSQKPQLPKPQVHVLQVLSLDGNQVAESALDIHHNNMNVNKRFFLWGYLYSLSDFISRYTADQAQTISKNKWT